MVDRRPEVISVLSRALEDRKSAGDAVWALQGFGPDALPVLPKLLAILADGKSEHWYSVATIVSQIGPAARAAAPTLRLRLAEPQIQIRIQAAKSLSRVAPDDPLALAALIRLEQQVPGVVTEDLGRLGPSARAAIPTLRRTMRYADDEVYQKAVNALRRIDPGDNAKP